MYTEGCNAQIKSKHEWFLEKKKCKKCLKYSPRGRKNAKHFLELVVGRALQPRSQLLVTTKVIKCATNKQTNKFTGSVFYGKRY